jgi:DNA-binding transcriptional LysR family regulator
MQVKALERSLGEPLLERQGRRLLLTPAGHILLRQAEHILELVEQTGDEIAALKGMTRGRLTIGTNDSYCLYLLPELVQLFHDRFPGIELHLTNNCSTQVASSVVAGEADFGFVTLPIPNAHVESKPLLWREDVLVCAPEHPLCSQPTVTLKQVAAHPLLLLDRGSSRALLDKLFVDAGLIPKIVIELGSVEVIKRYVEIDLGLSIIPRFAAEREISEGRLHATGLDWLPRRAVGIIRRRTGYLSPAALNFVEFLEDYACAHWGKSSLDPEFGQGE